ncbi:MFS multidrug transporter-like protein [Elsinoe ampelina]|uniref:MFS multidrug transporter-like protein n=1 Tax=Elsinoe ampelina TaxID=302913 RepID=A0A6A6GLT2_9PEZI|nr:MFS multidrug transporter-like protein [Elsinoe ampelina]
MSASNDNVSERSPLLRRWSEAPVLDDEVVVKTKPISTSRAVACVGVLGILIMLQATNISLLTVTQSAIASDLDAFEEASWFTSSYLIAMSSAAPINGKLAQILSPRISIFISTIILAIGTLATAFVTDFTGFVVGRAATGTGASGIFTVAVIIVLDLATPEQRGLLIGVMNMLMTVGVSAGATVAGALLPVTGWRPLFWMQSPISVFCGILILFIIPKDFGTKAQQASDETMLKRLAGQDYLGAATLTLSIVLMLLAISSPTRIPIWPIILSLIILAAFVVIEVYYASEPIIPISLLRSRGLFFTCAATVGYMMSRWTVLFYTPTYAIAVRGWSPATGGAILIPTNAGFAAGGLLVGWLHIKRNGSFYTPALITYILFPITFLVLSLTSSATSSPALYVFLVFTNGFITGASLNYTFAHLLHLTPKSTHFMATSLVATFRGFAGSFASAAGGGYFVRVLRDALTEQFAQRGIQPREGLTRKLLGSPALVRDLSGLEKEAAAEGYTVALKALWLGAAVIAASIIFLQASTGWKKGEEVEKGDRREDGEEARS